MNDIDEERMIVTDAADIEAAAALWLERRDRVPWTEQDQTELDAWLAASPAHTVAYWRLDGAWEYADRLAALRGSTSEGDVPARSRPALRMIARAVAAMVVVAVTGAVIVAYVLRPAETKYTTSIGGRQTITLADGSKIELDTDTVLRTAVSSDRRIAWLDKGQAYFQIVHDASRPFIVMAGNRRVTDLGTAFMIRRDTSKLEVAVMEGRVWFDTAEGHVVADGHARPQSVLLTPGDSAVATTSALSLSKGSVQKLSNELGWRRGVLIFNNTTLADAAAEFNRYNRQKLVIADSAAGRLVIGATFKTNDVELFARVTRAVLGLHVEKRGEEMVISR